MNLNECNCCSYMLRDMYGKYDCRWEYSCTTGNKYHYDCNSYEEEIEEVPTELNHIQKRLAAIR